MNLRAENVRLPQLAKGKTYDLLIPITKNGAPYPDFDDFQQSGWGIRGAVRKNNAAGDAVAATWAISQTSPLALISLLIASDVTEALDCEILVWEVEGYNGNVSPDYVYGFATGTIEVLPEVVY